VGTRYDGHCHLFNLKYLVYEATAIAWDKWTGDYPRGLATDAVRSFGVEEDAGDIWRFLKWLAGLGGALFLDEEAHLDAALKAAGQAWGGSSNVVAVPLMMDIYYMLAAPMGPGNSVKETSQGEKVVPEYLRTPALAEVELKQRLREIGFTDAIAAEAVSKARTAAMARSLERSGDASNSNVETPGFVEQRDALVALKNRRPGDLMPFFAVDPRRTGVVDAVLKGGFVGRGNGAPFWGIKLYPRLGFDPQVSALEPLYAWCETNGIPVTAHCNVNGFPPNFMKGYPDFGAPKRYEAILQKHPNLKLNLAHFGSENPDWTTDILRLVQTYPNVYSDFACYSDSTEVPAMKAKVWDQPKVRERLLFGTDYDVVYFTNTIPLDSYYGYFDETSNPGAFSRADLEQISGQNVEAFLGV